MSSPYKLRQFDMQLLRLKQALGVTDDQAVAEALGMSKQAFADRKRRDAFPADKLYALAVQRPDLKISAQYVLSGTGVAEETSRRLEAFPSRIAALRGAQGFDWLEGKTGIPAAQLELMEAGRATPSGDQFAKLVKAFPEHSPSWLAGGPKPELGKDLADPEVMLIRNYRECPPSIQAAIRELAAREAMRAAGPVDDQ